MRRVQIERRSSAGFISIAPTRRRVRTHKVVAGGVIVGHIRETARQGVWAHGVRDHDVYRAGWVGRSDYRQLRGTAVDDRPGNSAEVHRSHGSKIRSVDD